MRVQDYVRPNETLLGICVGGSHARVLRLRNTDTGDVYVRKVEQQTPGQPQRLVEEAAAVTTILQDPRMSGLHGLYPAVLAQGRWSPNDTSYFMDMEFLPGVPVSERLLSNTLTPAAFRASMQPTFQAYASIPTQSLSAAAGAAMRDDLYVKRPLERMTHLQRQLGSNYLTLGNAHVGLAALFATDTVSINQVQYPSGLRVVREVAASPALQHFLRPHNAYTTCPHGDLTILNMLHDAESGRIRWIDSRGLLSAIDTIYDFGKLQFSTSAFALLSASRYTLAATPALDASSLPAFQLRLGTNNDPGTAALRHVDETLCDMIAEHAELVKVVTREPHWRARVKFAAAVQCLNDLTYRVHVDPQAAVASFLTAAVLLQQWHERHAPRAAAEHAFLALTSEQLQADDTPTADAPATRAIAQLNETLVPPQAHETHLFYSGFRHLADAQRAVHHEACAMFTTTSLQQAHAYSNAASVVLQFCATSCNHISVDHTTGETEYANDESAHADHVRVIKVLRGHGPFRNPSTIAGAVYD